jgi:hypothetical protein
MSHASWSTVVGWGGVSIGLASTWAQFRRAREVSVDGVSLTTWLQFLLMGVFWVSYGLAVGQAAIVAGSLIVMPLQVGIVARLRPLERRRESLRAVAVITALCFAPAMVLGWNAAVLGTGVAMVATRVPQLRTLVRHRGDVGVSAGSWALGTACAVLWLGYYLGQGLWAPFTATAAATALNVAIWALAVYRHRQVSARQVALVAI